MIGPTYDLVAGTLLVIAGLVFVSAGTLAIVRIRRAFRRETTSIGQLVAGPAEVQGSVRTAGEPLLTIDGQPAIAIATRVDARWLGSKQLSWTRLAEFTTAVPAEIVDETGTCVVEFDAAAILGVTCVANPQGSKARELFAECVAETLRCNPAARAAIDRGDELRITQEYVPVDAEVVVAGQAVVTGMASRDGYRDGAPTFTLRATDSTPLFAQTVGAHRSRGGGLWPAVVVAAGGATAVVAGIGEWIVGVGSRGFFQ